ncbi:hypothetical protein F511_40578 [Dorcoceras hygrometricum]|uniref:Uncharacterized protein n=1 Tax=Dorcoceras hygrometricum TaxID=472368 RepID=A0A2Z7AHT1_9LAMI|nr:hypothetical protein F511_40578 [Dorcoceras hygrometricum]
MEVRSSIYYIYPASTQVGSTRRFDLYRPDPTSLKLRELLASTDAHQLAGSSHTVKYFSFQLGPDAVLLSIKLLATNSNLRLIAELNRYTPELILICSYFDLVSLDVCWTILAVCCWMSSTDHLASDLVQLIAHLSSSVKKKMNSTQFRSAQIRSIQFSDQEQIKVQLTNRPAGSNHLREQLGEEKNSELYKCKMKQLRALRSRLEQLTEQIRSVVNKSSIDEKQPAERQDRTNQLK